MRTKIDGFIWIAATIVAAIVFYLQSSANKSVISKTPESTVVENPHKVFFGTEEELAITPQKSLPITNPLKPSLPQIKQSPFGSTNKSNSPESKITPSEQSLPPLVEAKPTEKITDADAKKVIPYPFNLALGIFQENDRERYKEFSDAQLSDDWDITMQGQLVDAIYSHPNANALTIDSVSCKAHICELRLLAANTKVWPLIYADLRQQPWWQFGNNYSAYEFGIKQDTQIKTVYFILLYKV